MTRPRIGVALSGGGFRAAAFGLGCLRALHDRDLLRYVDVVSGISGGSLLTAMWAYGPEDFPRFDQSVVDLLTSGLQAQLLQRALNPSTAARNLLTAARSALTSAPRHRNRTDALTAALTAHGFGRRLLADTTRPGLRTVISATDTITGNAVRFGSKLSSCSAHGKITTAVTVAEAVAASAAYPLLLPTINRQYEFEQRDGSRHTATVALTDGGVYDNLGLTPLLPDRSPQHTAHTYQLDYLIVVDAGRGRTRRTPAQFMPGRLGQSFEIIYGRTQDASRSRLHEIGASGQVQGFAHAYLGMRDENLPMPMQDLVPRARVCRYPTNLAAMKPDDLNTVAVRGEQLTRALIAWYCPNLA